ncbi:hypothetical protein F9L02_03280 [Brucella intermedia]|nr:hypothetical protein F9L02_03280 [Brucella intermedia]
MGLSHRRSSFYSLAACSRLAAFIMRRPSAVLRAHEPSDRPLQIGWIERIMCKLSRAAFSIVADTRRS